MALIKCPECKKKISDTVSRCPKCGFSIVGYLSENRVSEEDGKHKKIKILIISAIGMLLILLSFLVYMYADNNLNDISDEENITYPLFEDSITTANDLLGKEITPILNGYIEDEDYTLTSNKDNIIYKFPFESFVLGSDPTLIIYVNNSTSKITKVQYSFRIENGGLSNYRNNLQHYSIRSELTDYYDVDPVYTYSANDKQIKITKEEFDNNLFNDKKTTFYITWENEKGKAVYSQTNLYEEKDEYGTLTFTKK